MSDYPVLLRTAIDAQGCRGLGELYRELLGLRYREGEESPTDGSPGDADWLVLRDDDGHRVLTIQEKSDTTPPTWPSEQVPTHIDAYAHGLQSPHYRPPGATPSKGRVAGRSSAV
jgi:hypothetical protein